MKKIMSVMFAVAAIGLPYQANAADENNEAATTQLQNQIFKLQAEQDSNEKQFDNAFKQIKKIEDQLPKLNEALQAQFKQAQADNMKMMKELQGSIESQLQQLTNELNGLKERLAKKKA